MNHKALEAYILDIAGKIGLRDWDIHLGKAEPPEGTAGCVVTTYGKKDAEIFLVHEGLDRNELRTTVVHELVHLHLDPVTDFIHNDLEGLVSAQEEVLLTRLLRRQMEYAVDAIAIALAKFLPQPPKAVLT